MDKRYISGWGRNKFYKVKCFNFTKKNFIKIKNFIPRGNGNSYGDTSINDNVLIQKKKRIIFFDEKKGIIKVETGITIGEILEHTVKKNWILKVIPGAKQVTVAGAIANDIHGKNHYKSGCFSKHLIEFSILTQKKGQLNCSLTENEDLFKLTCGGIGLTGVIDTATIALKKIKSSFLITKTIKCESINSMIKIFEKNFDSDYIVGWYNFFSKKDKFIISVSNHTVQKNLKLSDSKQINNFIPSIFLNNLTIKLFNYFYYFLNKNSKKVEFYKKFFFPLDRIKNWNKIYGKNGFFQYQFVIPEKNSAKNLKKIISLIKKSKFLPYLAVVKKMGNKNNNYLSFPIEGYSFALDFKNEIGIRHFFNKLDKEIIKMKGRIYLAKDSNLSSENFSKMYPKVEEMKKNLKKYNVNMKLCSLQSTRLNISNL